MSENILATSYKTLEEAIKTANQIRRASLLIQEEQGFWKLLITNDRFKLREDFKNMNLSDADGYININDSQGNILRNRVQLTRDDLAMFTEFIGKYSGHENILSQQFNDMSKRFKNLITQIKKENVIEQVEEKKDRSGVYEIRPMEYSCHFKTFRPQKILLQQKVDSESYTSFMMQITFNNKAGIETLSPLFRKSKISIQDLMNALSQGKSFQVVVQLKDNVLEKMKFIMYSTEDLEKIMNMKNPLGKAIFTNLSNYLLADLKII